MLHRLIPWYVKIPAKIVLSRLPVKPRTWQKLNLFRAGAMDDANCALNIFRSHLKAAGLANLEGCSVLELGPGNGLLTAVHAHSLGAQRTWLIDAEELAEPDTGLLTRTNSLYLTRGLESLKEVPDGTVDFLFSNAVLEHVPLPEFVPVVREMRRVLSPGGVASHNIDFRDHLQCALNNLRFRESIWESRFMSRSGFYTNRIRWPRMKHIFEEHGFSVQEKIVNQWPNGLPTKQSRMAPPFRDLRPYELMTMDCQIVLSPRRFTDSQ